VSADPGVKHDQGKPSMRLLPWSELAKVVRVLEFGARKYSEGGWRSVPDGGRRYLDATIRHIGAFCDGEEHDPESGLHHLAHAACSLLFALQWVGEEPSIPATRPEAP
jgi:hypothetical protein